MVAIGFKEEPEEVAEAIRRVTFRLPLGIDHVHCYFLRSSGGGWILVDTGLGLDDPEAVWRPVLDALDAPVESILVTHAHPDHVGGAADVAALTGAVVYEGRHDYEIALAIWGGERAEGGFDAYLRAHGTPEELLGAPGIGAHVRIARDPVLLDEGDELDGWRVAVLPGHADGHVVLERDGVLVAGDTILGRISPHVGLYPGGRPDPLADFLASLERIEALAPRLALPGHGPLLDDAAARAREIAAHHGDRLDRTAAALGPEPRTAYEVALRVFGDRLPAGQRRFALTEALAHLERLVRLGRAERVEGLPIRFAT
jgi:glyoxylase-like metal-dependent hydrolase (beta-lactamase superfamily II)